MLRVVPLIAIASCGRVGFDPRTDATSVPIAHDEDGDGVRDIDDVCPYLPGSQLDGDGDRVGDDCDPNPSVPRDTIAVFATMMPGDQPFTLFPSDGTWTQLADALELDGPPDTGDGNMSGHLELPIRIADARIAFGFDIVNRIEPGDQMQFAVGASSTTGAFVYYTELNEIVSQFEVAQILSWNSTQFMTYMTRDLATVIHPGSVEYQATHRVGGATQLEIRWPGEPYQLESMDGIYPGGDLIVVNLNNLHVRIRYACVITSS